MEPVRQSQSRCSLFHEQQEAEPNLEDFTAVSLLITPSLLIHPANTDPASATRLVSCSILAHGSRQAKESLLPLPAFMLEPETVHEENSQDGGRT